MALVGELSLSAPRARIAGPLWPESSEAQARTNLRDVLHTLPQVEEGLDVTRANAEQRGAAELDVAGSKDARARRARAPSGQGWRTG